MPVTALRIGVLSDTHGLLRPEATAFLHGCDHILHGGDIGGEEILAQLAVLAPVSAVRGNNDTQAWAASLPDSRLLELAGVRWYVIHDLGRLALDLCASGVRIIVSGHSHQPCLREQNGVIYLNPGSAGPRRFKLPIGIAEVRIAGTVIAPRLVELHGAAR
jgi:putative phosphoesterase